MELSIKRWNAVLVLAVVVGGGYLYVKRGGQVPELPPEVREVLPDVPGASPAPAPDAPKAREPRRSPEPVVREPEPAPPADAAPKPVKRERTADEKARSKVALAIGYAENGRFDLAYAALEEAEKLGPGDDVKQEIAAATEQVTTLMRSKRR